MKKILNEPYVNQVEIDKMRAVLDNVSPGLTPSCYMLKGDERIVTAIVVTIPMKGNKYVIEKLVSLGFKKGHKRKLGSSRAWGEYEKYSFQIDLTYYLPRC